MKSVMEGIYEKAAAYAAKKQLLRRPTDVPCIEIGIRQDIEEDFVAGAEERGRLRDPALEPPPQYAYLVLYEVHLTEPSRLYPVVAAADCNGNWFFYPGRQARAVLPTDRWLPLPVEPTL